jgi:hypothetical protein
MTLRGINLGLVLVVGCWQPPSRGLGFQALAQRYGVLVGDTIYFRSPEGMDSTAPQGAPPESVLLAQLQAHYRSYQDGDFAVLGVAAVGPADTLLALRAPSQYSPSGVDLWRMQGGALRSDSLRVADQFGDGPWYFSQDAWLVDLDGDGLRDLVQRRRDWWLDDETGAEQSADSLWVHPWRSGWFAPRQDTVDATLSASFRIRGWPSD